MLEIEGLSAGYAGSRVLDDVSFSTSSDASLGILGTNGVGKTTLLRCIAGLHPHTSGTIRLDGVDISKRRTSSRVRSGLVLVPEGHQAFPNMTVEENLWLGASPVLRRGRARGNRGSYARVFKIFPRLEERRGQAAGTLSGGERQMLGIARALLADPVCLLLDEPSQGLSPKLVEEVAEAIKEVQRTTAVLLVEQNLTVPRICSDRVIVLAGSKVVAEGPTAELIDSDLVTAAYLGV